MRGERREQLPLEVNEKCISSILVGAGRLWPDCFTGRAIYERRSFWEMVIANCIQSAVLYCYGLVAVK